MASIFIVDDELSITEALSFILSEEGHHVVVANNGATALSKLAEFKPDLILTDFMMPRMNGAELTRTVRQSEQHASVKIVMMSGALEASLHSVKPLYDAFLRKPFDIDTLLHQLHRLLGEN